MTRRTPLALVLLTLAAGAIIAIPASAVPPIGEKDNGLSKLDERYLQVYKDCWEAFGADCGRNRVDDGNEDGTQPSDAQVAASTERMKLWLNPPEPEPVAVPVTESVAPAPVETSVAPAPVETSSGGCPSYMAAEATSPTDVNPTSGAAGCYQVLPSTAAAMGAACADVNADSCVAAICAAQGNDAWAASGATPCG